MVTLADIVDEARRHLGTPYAHQGRLPGPLDCVGLIVGVAAGLGLSEYDDRTYGPMPDGVSLHRHLEHAMIRLASPELAQAGDMLTFWLLPRRK